MAEPERRRRRGGLRRPFPPLAVAAACATLIAHGPLAAQQATSVLAVAGGAQVGGELDNYLRYLESLARTPLLPWGLRPFAPPVADTLARVSGSHPWRASWMFSPAASLRGAELLPVSVTEYVNTSYPYGINEGPVWAGRGLTSAVSAGVAYRAGPLTMELHPIAFRAENASFPLRPTGQPGLGAFRDPRWEDRIDRPQRFGNGAYARLEPGESTIRLDALGVSLGVTTANEWWGPASTFPFIVGNNAAGVPRAFVGTERPVSIYIGTVQARVEYGLELQSRFSPVVGPDTFVSADSAGRKRLMSGLVVTFSPRIFPGLELDAGRYFHEAWSGRFTASDLRTPFEGLLKQSIARGPVLPGIDNRDVLRNQLASVSFRWVLPHSGMDVYGEYGREDFAENARALQVQPDLSRVYMLGFRKAFAHADSSRVDAIRAEVFDGDPTAMGLYRPEGRAYVHYPLRQGHTEEGKLIGAGVGAGAPAAAEVAWERYRPSGRTTLYLRRMSENVSSELPSEPWRTGVAGLNVLRFTSIGNVTADIAAVRTTQVPHGWGGWNLSAIGGVVIRVP